MAQQTKQSLDVVTVTYPPTCPYALLGAEKPTPPVVYLITGTRAQNVRSAPRLGALAVDSIPRDGKDGKPIAYPVYWIFDEWLALDNVGGALGGKVVRTD